MHFDHLTVDELNSELNRMIQARDDLVLARDEKTQEMTKLFGQIDDLTETRRYDEREIDELNTFIDIGWDELGARRSAGEQ